MNFIIDKEQYLKVKEAWKTIEEKNSMDHVIYNVLRGFEPKRGFSPVQSKMKLANGFTEWMAYNSAMWQATRMFQPPTVYSREPAERTAANLKSYNDKLGSLKIRYGVEFTPELIALIQGVLK